MRGTAGKRPKQRNPSPSPNPQANPNRRAEESTVETTYTAPAEHNSFFSIYFEQLVLSLAIMSLFFYDDEADPIKSGCLNSFKDGILNRMAEKYVRKYCPLP